MTTLDVWYAHLSFDQLYAFTKGKRRRRLDAFAAHAQSRDNLKALGKLATRVDGEHRIRSDPPLLLPLREAPAENDPAALEELALHHFALYKATLDDERRHLLERYRPVDVALKVVGVGSVGTRCLIMLLVGRDANDVLFLQFKEAGPSVLEEHQRRSRYRNHGRRVVEGQRLMQASSDIFLGWSRGPAGTDFYWRQLQDWKGSVDVDNAPPSMLAGYAAVCGWTLAWAHARSGDPVAIGGYLGTSPAFDDAVTAFALAYAEQNQRDYESYRDAIVARGLEVAPS